MKNRYNADCDCIRYRALNDPASDILAGFKRDSRNLRLSMRTRDLGEIRANPF